MNGIVAGAYGRPMSIIATIMNSATGQPIQKMTFQRMPKPWVTFHLATGETVTADRVNVGKAPVQNVLSSPLAYGRYSPKRLTPMSGAQRRRLAGE